MQGDQQFEIGENIESTAKMGIFAKYFLPYIIKIGLGIIFIIAAVLLVPFLTTFFPQINITQIGQGVFVILVLILTLVISK